MIVIFGMCYMYLHGSHKKYPVYEFCRLGSENERLNETEFIRTSIETLSSLALYWMSFSEQFDMSKKDLLNR